ncbi:hypothetical protein V2V90_20080 [Agrobacterium leguminum]|uniref:hypothetical protein n=1 Tax=Agrobacterium leguminum TaxID=2792015 RepID=UPI0030D301B9
MRNTAAFTLISLMLATTQANAVEFIDIAKVAADLSAAYGSVPVRERREHWGRQRICPDIMLSVPPVTDGASDDRQLASCYWEEYVWYEDVDVPRVLTVSNLEAVLVNEPTYGKPEIVFTENSRLHVQSKQIVNCTAVEQSGTASLSLSFTVSSTTTLSRSLSNTRGFNLNVRYSYGGFGIGGGATYSETVSNTESTSKSKSETISRSNSDSLRVPPKNSYVAEIRMEEVYGRVPFSAIVLIDGDLSGNNRGLKRLSEIASVAQRSFEVTGMIQLGGGANAKTVFRPIPFEQSLCEAGDGLVVRDIKPDLNYYPGMEGVVSKLGDLDFAKSSTTVASRTRAGAKLLNWTPSKNSPATIASTVAGEPGAFCYMGPCEEGTGGRNVCYFDEEGACNSCYIEPDPVCEPAEPIE